MARVAEITQRDQHGQRLLEIWESAVRETHSFLSEADILQIRPEVLRAIAAIEHLRGFFHEDGSIQGFIGVENQKVEMLFVDAGARGQGVGKQLLCVATAELDARFVDVNEQNQQGVGFYNHMGFVAMGRSDCDDQGRPFPILHLKLHGA